MRSAGGRVPRVGVVDLVNVELPFVLALAGRLRGRVEFAFLQTRTDTHALLRAHGASWHTPAGAAPALDWSDDELLEACGAHERQWSQSLPALLATARPLAAQLQDFLIRQRIDAVLIWNGAPLARALAAHAAARLGLRRLYCENGYLPGTMQLDGGGVNGGSSHAAAIAAGAYRGCAYDAGALDDALARLRSGAAVHGAGLALAVGRRRRAHP